MFKIINYFLVVFLIFTGCINKNLPEDPNDVAKNYCICIEEGLINSKDLKIDLYGCEKKIFPKSRLMRIYLAFDEYNNYDKKTIDSAKNFSLNVRDIIDSMCFNRVAKARRLKK